MSSIEPAEYQTILETIRHWPPEARRDLAATYGRRSTTSGHPAQARVFR